MVQDNIFWADRSAKEIVRAHKRFAVATGITPSGEIHIGNLREVVTADAVVRALRAIGQEPKFIYIADTFDPLRRVYPFLDEATFAPHVGKPLSETPCPCGDHESYAEHFLEPFLTSLNTLDIGVDVVRADKLYKEGRYVQNILRALQGTEKIRAILKEETGKETPADWSPFNPICGKCLRMTGTKVVCSDGKKETVDYSCDCGDQGTVSMRAGGKLTWRVDWAARWEILGVTIEPFGKDHASSGGSYDTGVRIAREIFKYEPPFPIVYEWISLQGGGDMSSSKGNVIAIHKMLEVVPPEVLKYAVAKVRPNRRIVFNPGLPLLQLIDEYDDTRSKNHNTRAAQLSEVSGAPPLGVPFRHIVSLVQTAQDDVEKIQAILERNGYSIPDQKALSARARYARKWLESFAPEEVRFEVQSKLPVSAGDLSVKQKEALRKLADGFQEGLKAEEIHALIYRIKDELKISPKEFFEAIYHAILGKERGPRAGFFLSTLDSEFVQNRLREVAASA